jgi:hypothetical protein
MGAPMRWNEQVATSWRMEGKRGTKNTKTRTEAGKEISVQNKQKANELHPRNDLHPGRWEC